jgi:hypothetical protein
MNVCGDADLRAVAAAWRDLPEAIKSAIVVLVRAGSRGE